MSDTPHIKDHTRAGLIANPDWRAVAAAFTFNGLLFGVWASRIPAFKEGFEIAPGTLGLLLLALAGGAIVSFPVAGALSERKGADRLSVLCALGYAPALILLALAPNVVLLAAALFVFGMFHGSMDVAMNGWGAQVETRLKRNTMSIFHALFSLGAGLGAASGYGAIQLGFSPLAHFSVVALIAGCLSIYAMQMAVSKRSPTGVASASTPTLAMPSGTLILVGLTAFSVSMGEGAIADWSAVFLRAVTTATEAQAALGYAAFSTTMVLTRLSGGLLVERFGAVRTTQFSGLIAFSGLITANMASSLWVVLVGFALVGIGYAVVMPLVFSRAAQDPHMRPGPAIASVATLGYGGMLLGPAVVGFIAQISSLQVSFAGLAIMALVPVFLAHHLTIKR